LKTTIHHFSKKVNEKTDEKFETSIDFVEFKKEKYVCITVSFGISL
jgi:hypothetical protein